MNQGRIWCVVSPTVGLPLFLGSVAITSLVVHTAVMTHTTWMSSYWAGSTRAKTALLGSGAAVAMAAPGAAPAFSLTVTPVPTGVSAAGAASPASFVITVTPVAPTPAGATAATPEITADNATLHPPATGPAKVN